MQDVNNLSGHELKGWLLKERLGEGADGVVYEAEKDGRIAGIKIFFPDILEQNGIEAGLERLELQLQLKGRKFHENLVEVFEGGFLEDWKTIYIAMERVCGKSLDKLIGKIPENEIPPLLMQLASAAQFLEEHELVHRDIKPANIMISDDFKTLTLLDLGIVLKHLSPDEERLSGDEFVATTRYSPPEFVWRNEEASDENAWRAITFYQIGATLHDMIMGKPIFEGFDKPRARLYDAVRLLPPVVENKNCVDWICYLAKCCLVKNWRERLHLVSWASFKEAELSTQSVDKNVQLIRLRQIRAEEYKNYEANRALISDKALKNQRAQELWDLQNKVFLDVRQFLIDSSIFPRFNGTQMAANEGRYIFNFAFDSDPERFFSEKIVFKVEISSEDNYELAFALKVDALKEKGLELFSGKWIEMLTVGRASAIIQQSLLEVAGRMVPNI